MSKLSIKNGDKFSRLTYITELESKYQKNGNRKRYGLFKCICGVEKRILIYSVTCGKIVSCGCYISELTSKSTTNRNTKHGLSNHDLFNRWLKIKGRCFNKKDKRYKDYGGRGIIMCKEWKEDFLTFFTWCIRNGYKPNLEIDRIDNDKDYSPDNCRFVTAKANCNNTRRNILVELHGVKMSLMQACEKVGLQKHYRMIWQRIKEGMPFDEIQILYK